MFKLLAKYSERWEKLSLGVTPAMLPTLSAVQHRVPILRKIWIQWDDEEHPSSVGSIVCFLGAPSLVDVGVFDPYHYISIPFPLHQLTRYELDGSLDMHLSVLRIAKNVVEARIEVDIPAQASSQIVEHLSLRRIYVSDAAILDYIKVPALEELALWVTQDGGAYIRARLPPFLDRSSCRLRRLCLRGPLDSLTTTEILSRFPSIIELVIILDDLDASKDVNSLMSDLADSTAVASHLRHIFLGCENGSYIDYSQYLRMLNSRWMAPGCVLQSTALLMADGLRPDPATLSGLEMLRQDGLDLLLLEGLEAAEIIDGWNYNSLCA